MSFKYFAVFCFVSVVICEEITKKSDSQIAGADFVPQFQTFQFPPQPVFTTPQDLTALQQTHVLGNFHHRFHPTRLSPQFGVSPPLVFTPQTHIVPPQPTIVQAPIQQSLVPPQSTSNHHEVLRPPAPQEVQPAGLVPPQPNLSQNFKTIPTQKPAFPSPSDQSIKNSFPSNAPHTIKFSISSLNYNPNQAKQQVNPPPSQSASSRFVGTQQQNNALFNQANFRQQTTFSNPTKTQQTNFQSFNLNKPELNQQNFNVQTKPTLSPSPIPSTQDLSRFQLTGLHSSSNLRPQQTNDVSGVSILPSVGNVNNFKPRPTETQPKFTQQNFEIRQNSLPQTQFTQQQFVQPNFDFSQSQHTNLNLLQPTPQTQFQFQQAEQPRQTQFNIHPSDQSRQTQYNIQQSEQLRQSQFNIQLAEQPQQTQFSIQPTDQSRQTQFSIQPTDQSRQTQFSIQPTDQPRQTQFSIQPTDQPRQTQFSIQPTDQPRQTQFNIQPSIQSNFEFRSTQQPSDNFQRQQDVQNTRPTFENANQKDIFFQKSQEQTQYTFSDSFTKNEISASPSPTTAETFTTLSTKYRKPKPIVKEITINLNDQKITGDIPAQLYIKEDRQKEFQEIKEQDSKDRKGKKEKSQEDIINEQIQKLLQSHNLEIIDKDNDSQTESQEAQLSQFSEQFKKKYNYSVQLLNGGSILREVKPKKKILTTLPPLPELPEHIKKQYDIKLVNREDLFKQFDLAGNHKLSNDSSVFLANGQQLELVKFSKDGIMNKIPIGTKTTGPTTTAKPPKVLFEELKRGVLPPGADFELIKHKGDGQVEKVNDLPSSKKVTFVFLEEQPDGSVKIQGVKGNANQEAEGSETVDSLIKKIKDGSLKLPPSKQGTKSLLTNEIPRINPVTEKNYVTLSPVTSPTPRSINRFPSTSIPYYSEKDATEQGPTTDFSYSSPYAIDIDATLTPTPFYETTPEPTTFLPTVNYIRSSTRKPKTRSRVTFLPTVPSVDTTFTPTFGSKRIKPTTAKSTLFKNFVSSRKAHKSYTKAPRYDEQEYETLSHRPTEYSVPRLRVPQEDVVAEESSIDSVRPINEILSENGLTEMAKFLDQSGLDTILNETGPYTIFIPTDKAFRTLEDQLGGPDKAEDKFRENPRLLSGLLLHHVVPGSFRLEDLQDEMTGVSLAGTQLRVNTYDPEEKERNEERIVTINGAKVSSEKKDILVPQGLAHAIDRVLFPLPVGDILQTLRGDRERRFTKFLKSLESSGLTDMLTGTKTYTVFAPTDKAFAVLTDSELDKLLTRREAARTIVLRHIVPGTLYSAGMNYYQVKESMETGQKIVIKKESGKIKANSAQIVSANIPATNGVVHAVESLL